MFMSKRPIDTWGLLETFIDDALDGFMGTWIPTTTCGHLWMAETLVG